MLWLRPLVAGLSLLRSQFNPTPVYVGFALDNVALGQVFSVSTVVFPYQYHTSAPYSFMHPSPTLILSIIWQCRQVTRLKIDYHTWQVGRFLEGCGLGVFGTKIFQESEKFCEMPRLLYPITRRRFELETFRIHYLNTATSTCPEHPWHSKLFPYF